MFFITTIRIKNIDGNIDQEDRTVGYYRKWEDAYDTIINNNLDIFECGYYQYAVINKIGQGLYPALQEDQWFKYETNDKGIHYNIATISRPKEVRENSIYIIG